VNRALSLEQFVSALQRKGVPLPFEIGAFIVLEACERVATEPAWISAASLRLSDDGELVTTTHPARAEASDRETCRALSALLGELLVCSAQSVPPRLLRLVEPGAHDGPVSVAELRDELAASLVPLNRAAMRRVLARLVREARRERDDGQGRRPVSSAPERDERELDALLAGRSASQSCSPPRELDSADEADRDEDANDELDAVLEGIERGAKRPSAARAASTAARAASTAARAASTAVANTTVASTAAGAGLPGARPFAHPSRALAHGDQGDVLDQFESLAPPRSGLGAAIGMLGLLAALGLAAAYFALGRERSRAAIGIAEPVVAAPAPTRAPAEAKLHGELRVTSAPPRAQVFMRVGSGPALVPKLPVGVAHEFLAYQAGYAPSRAVVPASASWESQSGQLRYELALQLRETTASARQDDLGASRLPDAMGTPTGALGSVRVITSPQGAEVYQLIGFAPDVAVQNVPVHDPIELLLYLPSHDLKRVRVGPADFQPRAGELVADVNVALTASTPAGTPRKSGQLPAR
jgi:hypothetical protein